MEIKRALEIIEEEMPFTSGVIEEAMETIRDVVAKQTPKKVMPSCYSSTFKRCPRCDENLTNYGCYSLNSWKYNYCSCCGQRLKWDKDIGLKQCETIDTTIEGEEV